MPTKEVFRKLPSKIYWGRYYSVARKKTIRRSLKTENRALAKKRLRQHELDESTPSQARSGITVAELGDLYAKHGKFNTEGTRSFYKKKLRVLTSIIGEFKVACIDRQNVEAYQRIRKTQTFKRRIKSADGTYAKDADGNYLHEMQAPKDATIRKELIALRQLLSHGEKKGIWAGDLKSIVPPQKEDANDSEAGDRWLTKKEFEILFGMLRIDRQFWLLCAVNLGCRLSELHGLRWEDIDLETRTIRIRGTKTAKARRSVPISKDLMVWINAIPEERRFGNLVERWNCYHRDLNKLCEKIRVPPICANDFRRTFCSWMLQNGVTIDTLVLLMGHSSRKMIERVYGQLGIGDHRRAIDTLPSFDFVHRAIGEVRSSHQLCAKNAKRLTA